MTKEEAYHIIDYAMQLLEDPTKWSKDGSFDETCNESSDAFTLSCALKTAHHKILGPDGYESRSNVMVKVRWMIRRYFIWRHGLHPITHFNKHRNTTHNDLMFILAMAAKSFKKD